MSEIHRQMLSHSTDAKSGSADGQCGTSDRSGSREDQSGSTCDQSDLSWEAQMQLNCSLVEAAPTVLFMGESGVGKTVLVDRLLGKRPAQEPERDECLAVGTKVPRVEKSVDAVLILWLVFGRCKIKSNKVEKSRFLCFTSSLIDISSFHLPFLSLSLSFTLLQSPFTPFTYSSLSLQSPSHLLQFLFFTSPSISIISHVTLNLTPSSQQ